MSFISTMIINLNGTMYDLEKNSINRYNNYGMIKTMKKKY